jgi:hypothetical protein
MTPAINCINSGVVDTRKQFFSGIVDTGDKFLAFWLFLTGINDTGEKCYDTGNKLY